MTELKATPGPWTAHATGLARSGKPEFEIHYSKHGECVAEIVHGEYDARLIAAAPELLALAERVARLNRDSGEIGPGMLASLVDEARAIIKTVGATK